MGMEREVQAFGSRRQAVYHRTGRLAIRRLPVGPVAQLDRVPRFERGGCGSKPCRDRHFQIRLLKLHYIFTLCYPPRFSVGVFVPSTSHQQTQGALREPLARGGFRVAFGSLDAEPAKIDMSGMLIAPFSTAVAAPA